MPGRAGQADHELGATGRMRGEPGLVADGDHLRAPEGVFRCLFACGPTRVIAAGLRPVTPLE